jgi:hypothetical protein
MNSKTRLVWIRLYEETGDISQLPDVEGSEPAKKKFKTYPIGFFLIEARSSCSQFRTRLCSETMSIIG